MTKPEENRLNTVSTSRLSGCGKSREDKLQQIISTIATVKVLRTSEQQQSNSNRAAAAAAASDEAHPVHAANQSSLDASANSF